MFRFVASSFDLVFISSISFVILLGLLLITSASPSLAPIQIFNIVLGVALFIIASSLDYHFFKTFSVPFYVVTILLLLLVPIFGEEIKGSARWINFGFFRLQPSELAKLSSVLILSDFWSSRSADDIRNILESFVIILIPVAFVFFQPDLGNAIVLLSIWFVSLFLSGPARKWLITVVAIFVLVLPLGWSFLAPYQKSRIETFINPSLDPLGSGYSSIQSQIAIGSGQLFGRGLGHGTQSHLQFLPEHSTDFIFATLAEELGFVGAFCLIASYAILISRMIRISQKTYDRFSSILVSSIGGLFLFQASVNIGMNLGVLPVTGITLPLVSYGGSSVITSLVALGIVASVWRASALVKRTSLSL